MRQEMKMMPVSSACDNYTADEFTTKARNDQPVDLRVNSAIERSNVENFKIQSRTKEKPEKNLILATLLTMTTPSTSYRGRILYSAGPQALTSSKENLFMNKCENPRSVSNYFDDRSEYLERSQPYCQDTKRSIIDKLQIKRSFLDIKYPRYKTWGTKYPHEQYFSNISTSSGFITPNTLEGEAKMESTIDKEFLPNYRKFYSRCSNQSTTAVASSPQGNLDCTIIRERSTPSVWKYPPYAPHGHLYRLLQRDQPSTSGNNMCHKRKLSLLTDNANKKDKTLRCLLSSSVDSINIRHLSNPPSVHEKQSDYDSIKNHMKMEPCSSKNEGFPSTMYGNNHGRESDTPAPVYCPQAVRAIPDNTVLRGLLVSNCKIPILPPSGPPSSGSPGSESTSSGSTDSGVFSSDNIPDERRRASRVLSGRHVKSGTGASLTTLRLLRQMIMERKSKNDRKL